MESRVSPREEDCGRRNPLPRGPPTPGAGHKALRPRVRVYKALLAQFQAAGISVVLSAAPGICLAHLLLVGLPWPASLSQLLQFSPALPPSGAISGRPCSQNPRGPGHL